MTGTYQETLKTLIWKAICTCVHYSATHDSQDVEAASAPTDGSTDTVAVAHMHSGTSLVHKENGVLPSPTAWPTSRALC